MAQDICVRMTQWLEEVFLRLDLTWKRVLTIKRTMNIGRLYCLKALYSERIANWFIVQLHIENRTFNKQTIFQYCSILLVCMICNFKKKVAENVFSE